MDEVGHQAIGLDPLQHEAVAWVQRLISGQATAADAGALKRWCAQSPAHAAAFAEASRVWSDIGPAGLDFCTSKAERVALLAQLRQRPAVGRRAVLGGGLATAAVAAAYVLVDPPLGLWPSLTELNADYRTRTGEQRQITLANHVLVQMNTQTSIAVQPPEGEVDRIELIAGEASFAMAPQARRPLVVLAAAGQTIGSGARFDMRRLDGRTGPSVCVTCFDGTVRIKRNVDEVTLGPGQQVRYDASGLGRVGPVDPEIASAWQRGIVVFRSTPLAEVVEEINRYRPGKIILVNAELGRQPVNGRFRIDQMDAILTRLEQAFDAQIRTLPGGVVLLG
jgi:transmembrane sensor